MRLNKKLATSIAIVGAMAVMAPGSAHAATGVSATAVTGSGTISPGLTPVSGSPQSVTFTGQAAGLFVSADIQDVGALSCSFSGGSADTTLTPGPLDFSDETSLAGEGTVTGSCTGTGVLGNTATITCSFEYLRLTGLVVIVGTCDATAGGTTITARAVGVFGFAPTTASPTTSYALAGVAAGGTAP